jgi:hypothetical protein
MDPILASINLIPIIVVIKIYVDVMIGAITHTFNYFC